MKKASKIIIEYVENNEFANKEDLIQLVKDEIDIPSMDELIKRYIASVIARKVSTVRDEQKRRRIVARRGAEDTIYTNIEKCLDPFIIEQIRNRYVRKAQGHNLALQNFEIKVGITQLNLFEKIDAITTASAAT